MRAEPNSQTPDWQGYPWLFAALALAVTAARVAALTLSPLDLHGDEAQYWLWSRTPDWGYFSKPPLIAWAIAGTTALFGDAEWAVRLAAPLAHGLGAAALYGVGAAMFGRRVGFWSGLFWLTMPGVWLSASLISTDALLLPLWSFALLSAWRLTETRAWGWALALGVSVGLGSLAKYAMLYFPVGLALAALWSLPARRAFLSWQSALAATTALAIVAPNLFWNASNSFATVTHTVANTNLGADLFNPDELADFLTAQLGVFGPLAFPLLLGFLALRLVGWRRTTEQDRFLIAFILPALSAIAVQALASRAHGNWAAAAYPAATVFLTAQLLARRAQWPLWTNQALHAAIGAVFLATLLRPEVADGLGLSNALKRARAWEETAALIATRLEEGGPYDAVLVDNRLLYNDLAYYWRNDPPAARLAMWRLYADAHNHAEAVAALTPAADLRVLIVGTEPSYAALIAGDFTAVGELREIEAPVGGGIVRTFLVREAEGFAPAERDAAFLERVRNRPQE